jgi:hypothetical protein
LPDQTIHSFYWLGADKPCLDTPTVNVIHNMVVGCHGGNSAAGAFKNEDAALVWSAPRDAGQEGWEFAVLLDAHFSPQSAALVLTWIEAEKTALVARLSQPIETAFTALHSHLLGIFTSVEFRNQCSATVGEASCLICARRGRYLWWMLIGDCMLFLLHPELANLGQTALTQRNFFEWVGQRNTFDLAVPCYSTGVRELQAGRNCIVMTTDGLLEYGRRPFEAPLYIYNFFYYGGDLETAVGNALAKVHKEHGEDSTTIIAWNGEG